MFFNKEKKQLDALTSLFGKLEDKVKTLTTRLEIQTTRLDALMKAYPYGANKDGSPRQKPGRKAKVQA
jgi:hypothetical protein